MRVAYRHEKSPRWAYLLGSIWFAGTLALLPATRSVAAEEQTQAEGTVSLDEIMVLAQRREENLQSVPIAISTVSGDELEARGSVDYQSLANSVPGLTMTQSWYSHTYIRGVGANNASPNNEPSAGTYVDGVYQPSSFGLHGIFNHVARIEVLKGPQGTLFGRNTTAGVVQIITRDPQHEFGGDVDVGYGNYSTAAASAYLTGGLTDNLAADMALTYEDQTGNLGHNTTTGEEIGHDKTIAARTKWLYTPGDSTKIDVALDWSKWTADGGGQMAPGSVNPVDGVTTWGGGWNIVGDTTISEHEQYGAALRLEQDMGSVRGRSITSYRRVEGFEWHDNDRLAARRALVQAWNHSDYVSQEFHVENKDPSKLTWLVGAFLYGADVDANDPRIESGTTVTPNPRYIYGLGKTRSYSGFAQGTWEFVPTWKLTAGVRYTDETLKEISRRTDPNGNIIAGGGPFNQEISFQPWTYRAALDKQFTPDVLGFLSFTHGFKSGGFNLATPGAAPFYPETVDAYELGMKSEFMQSRMRLNVSAFYYDYKDIQTIIVPGGASQIFTNAAAAENYGLDANLDFAASEYLTLNTGFELLNAEYTDYPNAQGFTSTGVAINFANAKGHSLPYAPDWSGFIGAKLRVPTSIGDIKATANVSYIDDVTITPAEEPVLPAHTLLTLSVEWWSHSESPFGVRIWGRNLLDEYYSSSLTSSSGGWYGNFADPRMYGLALMKQF